MADVQKLCGIKLGKKDAKITINLDRALAAGEAVTFRLSLRDPYRNTDLVATAESAAVAGGKVFDIPLQQDGFLIAYTTDGFAKVQLSWLETVASQTNGTAQLVIKDVTHSFPALKFILYPPPPPPPPPPLPPPPPPPAQDINWMLGSDRLLSSAISNMNESGTPQPANS